MFNRVIQTKLPQTVTVSDKQKDATVQMKNDQAKAKMQTRDEEQKIRFMYETQSCFARKSSPNFPPDLIQLHSK